MTAPGTRPFPRLAQWQLDEMRRNLREWLSTLPPCGIPHTDPYNPCMPDRSEDGMLWCVNPACGLRQRLAITEGNSA